MTALSLGLAVATVVAHVVRLLVAAPVGDLRPQLFATVVLVAAFGLTEGTVVHIRVRRGSHALGLAEVPMVLGLLFADPLLLTLARIGGGAVGLAGLRRQRGVKLGTNLALIGVQATLASFVFHSMVGRPTELGPMEWIAAYAAMLLADALAAVLITAVIALHDDPGEWRRIGQALQGILLPTVTTTVALMGAMLVQYDPRTLPLLGVAALVTFAWYRAHVRQGQGHAQVEELYTFTRALDGSGDTTEVARIVLTQVRDQLRAGTAELVVPGTRGYLRSRLTGPDTLATDWLPDVPAGAWWAPVLSGDPLLLPADRDRDREPPDAIAVPLPMGDSTGALLVTDSLPDIPTFTDEHVKLFQALANHASVALSKSLLVDRLRQEVAEKEHLALHDQLTGLPNRQRFNQLVEAALADGGAAAVILLDLDRFKEVNDALGHDIGDALLREVGAALSRRLGERAVVARLGGDEFAVLLPGVDNPEEAEEVGVELANELDRPVPVGQFRLNGRASIGIALAPVHGADARTLLQHADVAMYAAKESGVGRRVYRPEQQRNTPRRLAMIGELEQVIRRRDLLVVFQPKTDPVSGLVTGAEALARWHHPDQGFVPPDEFIPLAEHSGLIQPLTFHVLEVALRRCATWRRAGHDLHVAVNLSPHSLLDTALPDVVSRLLGQSGVPAGALTLELTESSFTMDPVGSMRTLERLNELGVKLAIDDFGTGYSSLGRLRELPIHEVKIDKSFVQRISVDHRDRAVVRSALQLGHALDLEVVAEGVEDSATYEHLARVGCNLVQGYYVSRPLPADEFLTWLTDRPRPTRTGGLILPGDPSNVLRPNFG